MDPDSGMTLTLLFIGLSFVLVALNGFFVAAEFSIVKVRRTRLEELSKKGSHRAKLALECVDNLDEYLSATQLGITLVSLALGWIGEESFYRIFEILFHDFQAANESLVHAVALGLSFFIVTMLHVVLGELVPKSMAIQRAEKITLFIAAPLVLFHKLARYVIHSFTWIANLILRLIGYHGEEESALSEEELKMVMQESHEEGVISDSEAQIIHKALSFSDKRAQEIMIPLDEVEYLSLDRSLEENLAVTEMSLFTRFPVIAGNPPNVVGIVHMKDVLKALSENKSMAAIENSLRPAIFVDPYMRQDQMMKLMNRRRTHMAVVHDPKTKRNIGLVTLEDILENLVGEIVDEHGN